MAKINSNSTHTERLAEVRERVEQQRGAIFQAQAIVQTVVKAMDPASWSSKSGYPYALELVDEMLERIAAELDGGVSEMDDSAGVQS